MNKNKIINSLSNIRNLGECILETKTLKEAFTEFSQGNFTYEQVKYFYNKNKEAIVKEMANRKKCSNCGQYFYPEEIEVANLFNHCGRRRTIDAILTLGISEIVRKPAEICPHCGKIYIMDK